jgi:hypothetical protein
VVDDLKARAVAINREKLNSAICLSLEEDSWSSSSRKFAALTGGGPGQCTFVGSYSNKDSEVAKVQADEINQTVMEALGVDTSRPPNDPTISLAKVANLTTDNPTVMLKTAELLSSNYRLFRGILWTGCL